MLRTAFIILQVSQGWQRKMTVRCIPTQGVADGSIWARMILTFIVKGDRIPVDIRSPKPTKPQPGSS